MWFTEQGSGAIGRIDRYGSIRQFRLKTYDSQPEGIAPGPGGALYFAENGYAYATHVGRISTDGRITEWNDSNAMPKGVAAFSGGSVWFTDGCGGLTVLDPRGKVSQYPLNGIPGETPAIVRAPDGALWFSEDGTARIGRIDASGKLTIYNGLMYQQKYNDLPYSVAVGPDGNLWWTATMSNVIWAMNLKGRIVHRFAIPTAGSQPWGITAGRDGALWFTETAGNKIGRVTTRGTFAEYSLPTANAKPQGIASDARGTIWFVESGANRIGRIGPTV
jgi:virginiamycin B lyase